jgi:hypothetical protein
VISIDNDAGNLVWESFPLFPQIKAFGKWSEPNIHQVIKTDKPLTGSRFSVYIWNRSLDHIYTDDWEITIEGIGEATKQQAMGM